jgi:hypothetical protein
MGQVTGATNSKPNTRPSVCLASASASHDLPPPRRRPRVMLVDFFGRPVHLLSKGEPIHKLIGFNGN